MVWLRSINTLDIRLWLKKIIYELLHVLFFRIRELKIFRAWKRFYDFLNKLGGDSQFSFCRVNPCAIHIDNSSDDSAAFLYDMMTEAPSREIGGSFHQHDVDADLVFK